MHIILMPHILLELGSVSATRMRRDRMNVWTKPAIRDRVPQCTRKR